MSPPRRLTLITRARIAVAVYGGALCWYGVVGTQPHTSTAAAPPPAAAGAPAGQRVAPGDRYGVIVAAGAPEQVSTLGLRWHIKCCDPDYTPPAGLLAPHYLPIDPVLDEDALRDLITRFPGTIWMIGNEPNVVESSPPGVGNASPERYAASLHYCAGIIPVADPSAKLGGPNILNWGFTCNGCPGYPQGKAWTEQMRNAYVARYRQEPPLDIWALHLYEMDWLNLPNGNAPLDIEQVVGIRAWMDGISGVSGKPLWLTEIGIHRGYPGLTFNEHYLAEPVGSFDYDHVERFMRTLFGWLNDNAESMGIEKWFIWIASIDVPEDFETTYAGIRLMDGLDAAAPINRLGRLYQQLAGVR